MAPEEISFGYALSRRWVFLLLSLFNIPVSYLALRVSLLGDDLQWAVWVLCAYLIVGPLGIQFVRLGREMTITVSERTIAGTNYFGRRVEFGWGEVAEVARVFLPMRGAEIVVLPRSGGEKIVFAETIDDAAELLGLIKERARGCRLQL